MRRKVRLNNLARFQVLLALLLSLSLVSPAAAQSRAQKKTAAHTQFGRAEKLRIALNGKAQKERTLAEYKAVVRAYRGVYLITPHAAEVTPSLVAIAETYQEMGRQFDAKYHQNAIDTYQFLLHEYPTSRLRDDALFTIGQIQQQDLAHLDEAEMTFQELLKRYPRSAKADQAREALSEISATREREKKASAREVVKEQEKQRQVPQVTAIRHWNADNYTRIVIDVEQNVKYESARIANPDRIYFDISRAKLSSTLVGKTLDVEGGFLKTIRVAQNQAGIVRLVLEVDKVRDYSAFLLPNPYRLVVDIYGFGETKPAAARTTTAKAAPPEKTEKPSSKLEKIAPAGKTEKAGRDEKPAKAETARAGQATKAGPSEREAADPGKAPSAAKAPRNGQMTNIRAMGLKVGHIVIDAGHGGHDTGTVGPSGLTEKEICLDIALRLGKMIKEKLPGVEVTHTREDDTFVPLENRTALANQVKADMFISIHANSSRDRSARGVETYYLNFATSDDALEVASRENAVTQSSIHELSDLLKKIARNEKIEESRELASEIQDALSARLKRYSRHVKDRGVKRAPFVVLIGANMPSVLAEVSFLSNPTDESALKKTDHRKRVVEGLFKGVEKYLDSIGSLTFNASKPAPSDR